MTFICNFDGLVGPTHNYAGLSCGNIASAKNKHSISNPKEAALQGLEQMSLVLNITGFCGIIPPQKRPNFDLLYQYGFGIDERKALEKASQQRPDILAAAWSASSMWTANAATITINQHKIVHITPASLKTMPHRNQELAETTENLKHIFDNQKLFKHHPASELADEGAANHMHIGEFDIFVYSASSTHFPARQSKLASLSVAHRHGCKKPIFLEQSAAAINAGAFHNDVVAVSHENLLIYHQLAYSDDTLIPNSITKIKIPQSILSIDEAIETYLFNSRILTNKQDEYILLAPLQTLHNKNSKNAIDFILSQNTKIQSIEYIDLQQSMANGGGPACLRIRVPLTDPMAVNQNYMLTLEKIEMLKDFIKHHYRDRIHVSDLSDIDFARETLTTFEKIQLIFN